MAMDIIQTALNEDFVHQDITTISLIPANKTSRAFLIAKANGIVCGLEMVRNVFGRLDKNAKTKIFVKDGTRVKPGQNLALVSAKTRAILSGERTALNFIQHLSGISTLTGKYAEKLKGSSIKIYDTRKTVPGLRELEKYAVRCGGGSNHRMNLKEMAMIKDNHLMEIKELTRAVKLIKSRKPNMLVEVECESLEQVNNALEAKADVIMLDNMGITQIKQAVKRIRKNKKHIEIEISGGINLKNISKYKNIDADRISVGAVTHSAPALDISLEIVNRRIK